MKKIKMAGLFLALFVSIGTTTEAAGTHTVNEGETLWEIAMDHGVSVVDIKDENGKNSGHVNTGETLALPSGVSAQDQELMARLVHAEAKGESYTGKVAVATVVLNRVASSDFPDSIEGVVYDVSATGYPSFSPVGNGEINKPADAESMRAVKEAIAFEGQGYGSLYFYNPNKASNHWIATRETTTVIGKHVFAGNKILPGPNVLRQVFLLLT
ncbi:cell wall hydrolase [Salibacterium aidingense]|uniref:cell wall hydrolase n=1 Tax=Salibacterium aidingense TaxID=384933 RepID=UPI000688601E|nr:cell wall hydrolase [Salibacterium aidingense]